MKFNDYQKKARVSAIYPELGKNIYYPTLGLSGEAGEVANKIKKILRDQEGRITKVNVGELADEMGDVLWYLSNLASELGVSLEKIARLNIQKLHSRLKRGKLGGSGDHR